MSESVESIAMSIPDPHTHRGPYGGSMIHIGSPDVTLRECDRWDTEGKCTHWEEVLQDHMRTSKRFVYLISRNPHKEPVLRKIFGVK